MKKQDNIKELFKRLEGGFDVIETPQGNQRRFLEKLNKQQAKPKKLNFWTLGSIAAINTRCSFGS